MHCIEVVVVVTAVLVVECTVAVASAVSGLRERC